MGCAASTQAARRIHFSQVVPDTDLEHKDAEQSDHIPMGHSDVQTGLPDAELQQRDETSQQANLVAIVVPDTDLEHKDAEQSDHIPMGHSDVQTGLPDAELQQRDEISQQANLVAIDVPVVQPMAEDVPAVPQLAEGPALLRLVPEPGVSWDSDGTLKNTDLEHKDAEQSKWHSDRTLSLWTTRKKSCQINKEKT
eukprot:TRINITY_DN5794_c0_g2_i1.p1 TRINITY_DN5794_c0_g2~~TRINITY_DN5794_c0_g2_i1.p1  ORF type:complete len:195 (-),score=28.06 TRINITY_DN5794_c0_g2_i1:616-1200(-)